MIAMHIRSRLSNRTATLDIVLFLNGLRTKSAISYCLDNCAKQRNTHHQISISMLNLSREFLQN